MIKKFIKISGTGKFLDYTSATVPSVHRTTDFEKINLIYGDNGSGKTTISLILASLKGNNGLLFKKRSFDRSIPQSIEILTDLAGSPKHTYSSNSWDQHYPNIEIFDIHFINENIYTGLEIQNTHKKNLFEIIFGQRGIQLKEDIQKLKEDIRDENKKFGDLKTKIERSINNAYKADDYHKLSHDPDSASKINFKEQEIVTAKDSRNIQDKSGLQSIPLFTVSFDLEKAKRILGHSIDSISKSYLDRFTKHKKHLDIDGNEEEWLKQGYNAIHENTCPFCVRPFDENMEIIEAYNQYFNEEYNQLLMELEELDTFLSKYRPEGLIFVIENVIQHNNALIEFWKTHIAGMQQIPSVLGRKDVFENTFETIKRVFEAKMANPIKAITSGEIDEYSKLVEQINTDIQQINQEISDYNLAIKMVKSAPLGNIQKLEQELNQLKAIGLRNDPTINSNCIQFAASIHAIGNLNTSKNEKQIELDTYSVAIFGTYCSTINRYLQSFAPYLEIKDMDSAYVGSSTQPMVKYALHVHGNEVQPEDGTAQHSFKYALSEGDKSSLALAFFLAKLEIDGNLQDKIIIFDDPVSSFDLNRKSTTIHNLLHLGSQGKQLIVLTHNIMFAGEFWRRAEQTGLPRQCSKIDFFSNTSCIIEYNIDQETLSSVLKDSLTVKNFLTMGCLSDLERRSIARCLRPALESYFHLKFFDLVFPNEWLGNFIDKIRNSSASDPYHRLIGEVQELSDVNDYSKKYHHRSNTNADNEPISDAELRVYCEKTLRLIQVI